MSSADKDSFTSSFAIWMHYILSFCLIAVARTSSTMLKKEVIGDIPVLLLILMGTPVVFAHCIWFWQWVCHLWPLLYLDMFLLFPLCCKFLSQWMMDYIKCFFCICWYDHVVFILHFVYEVNHIDRFVNVVPTLHSWNKSHLIMVYDLFDALLYLIC